MCAKCSDVTVNTTVDTTNKHGSTAMRLQGRRADEAPKLAEGVDGGKMALAGYSEGYITGA